MAIFAIGDVHLSLGASKPMDVFPGWEHYVERLSAHWRRVVGDGDLVVLAGDISWGMTLEQAREDFAFLEALPGRKLLVKGNHDYWWTTAKKMTAFFKANGFGSLSLLHNNCCVEDGVALCGTRSWLFDAGEAHDEKIMNREKGRLIASLEAAQEREKIVFLHYPPLCVGARADEILEILRRYGVRRCYYGHLHGASVRRAVQGCVDGVEYRLISADALDFCPVKISI